MVSKTGIMEVRGAHEPQSTDQRGGRHLRNFSGQYLPFCVSFLLPSLD